MSSPPTLVELLRVAIDERVARVWTSLPAEVVSYDATKQSVTVRPLVRSARVTLDGERVQEELPQIAGVPVAFPRGGGMSITWPLQAGDTVVLVFASHDISGWLENGGVGTPQDPRRHDLTDAIAIPGVSSFANPIPAAGLDNAAMVLRASLVKLGSALAADPVALSPAIDSFVSALGTWLDTHTHIAGTLVAGSVAVTGVTGVPSVFYATVQPAAAFAAATKVQAE